jgi:hypothetical protein
MASPGIRRGLLIVFLLLVDTNFADTEKVCEAEMKSMASANDALTNEIDKLMPKYVHNAFLCKIMRCILALFVCLHSFCVSLVLDEKER